MNVYVLVENSCGDVINSLDTVKVFSSKEQARAMLKKAYETLLKDLNGYEFDQNEYDDDCYSIIIQDDNWSIYEGCIFEREVH